MVGRPKQQVYDIKKNKTRWTIRPAGGSYWRFLPFRGTVSLRTFLLDVDAIWEPMQGMSDLIRGGVIQIKIPANREAHFRSIYKRGAEANPYKRNMNETRNYIKEVTLSQFSRGQMVPFTKKRPLPLGTSAINPSSIFFDATQGTLTVRIDSAKMHGSYDDKPSYKPVEVRDDGSFTKGSTKDYEVMLWWEDWNGIQKEMKDDYKDSVEEGDPLTGYDMADSLLKGDDNVKVHCSCPSFHWLAIKGSLKKRDAAVDQRSYPTKGIKNHLLQGNQTPLCKHSYSFVINMVRGPRSDRVREMVRAEIANRLTLTLGFRDLEKGFMIKKPSASWKPPKILLPPKY